MLGGRGGQQLVVLLLALFCCCCCCIPTAFAKKENEPAGGAADAAENKSPVLQLVTDTFADAIERQTSPALVMFVTQDCEACKKLSGDFAKIAANLKGIAPVGIVDCNMVAAVRTCRSFSAHSFPKILVFKPGSKVNPYTGGSMKDYSDFTGPVTAKTLITAVTDTLDTSHLTQLATSAQQQAFLQDKQDPNNKQQLAKVLLFTDKQASTVLAKGLSWAYTRRLLFAEVRPSDPDGQALADKHGVTKYPSIIVIKADGSSVPYSGALKAPELRSFLDGFAATEQLLEGSAGGRQGGVSDPLSQLAQQVEVQPLSSSNLTDIDGQDDMWLIAFHATTDTDSCSTQLEALHKLLVEVQGVVRYGSFNTTGVAEELLQPYQLDTAALAASPCAMQLVLLPYGDFKKSKGTVNRWTSGLDDAKALQEWILKEVPDFTSLISDEVEAQRFLDATAADLPKPPKASSAQERRAPIGKVVLFTNKAEVPGIYKALAMHFTGKSRMLFAWSTATMDGPAYALMQKMNVRKAPAMTVLFPLPPKPLGADNEEVPNSARDNMAMQQYMGPLKFQRMLAWLTAMSTLTGMAYKSHAGATKGPAPQDLEIRSQAQLQSACYDQPGLCLITLLDGRSDNANKHRDTVKQSAAAHAGQPVNWVVVDVSQQSSFRRAYGFSADQLPALVALSTKRMRFAQGAAPFGEQTSKQLVTKVLMGTAVTLPLPELPKLIEGGEAEEEQVVDVQEEFNLDEIMAEDVKDLYRKEERLKQADEELQREEQEKKKQNKKKKKKKGSKKKGSKSKKTKEGGGGAAAPKDEL